MGMEVYRSGRRGRGLRAALLLLGGLLLLLAAYVVLPLGTDRVVLLGSDARAAEPSRSDTIVVAKAGGGALAVPRDTLVQIPGVGQDKVNAALAHGGPELAVKTLEGLTGVPIGNYVVVDFGAVEEIVDALGGVTVEVDEPIQYTLDGRYVSIPAGRQTLDGFEALAYVRYRGGPTADIGRIGRQQEFLRALAAEAASPRKLVRLPLAARAAWANVDTNMNPISAGRLALRMWLFGVGEVELYPGTPQYINGIAYWVPDRTAGARAVEATIA